MGSKRPFKVGDWLVEPDRNRISRSGVEAKLRPQVMELLAYLAGRPGQVVGPEVLLDALWARKVVTSGTVYNCVAELRRALAADETDVRVETIPKRGYRLVASVTGLDPVEGTALRRESAAGGRMRRAALLVALVSLGALVTIYWYAREPAAVKPFPANDITSIAVLPFADMSPGSDHAFFADGIAEELMNALARLDGLSVVSHSSSFALRNSGLGSSQIADRLGVDYLLEGSVRTAGDRIRVTAQLIDARADQHLWSQTYDRRLDDIFAIQDDISASIVNGLKLQLSGRPRAANTTDPEAYELYLRGRHRAQRRGTDLVAAQEFFERAIAVDPDYAPAHAGLATALLLQILARETEPAKIVPAVQPSLNRALALDAFNAQALATSGVLLEIQGRMDEARDAYERAIASNPSSSDAHRWLAMSFAVTDPTRYLALIERGYRIDPLVPGMSFHRAMAHARFGRHREALDAAREYRYLRPASHRPYNLACHLHHSAGRLSDAVRSCYHAWRMARGDIERLDTLVWVLINLREYELAAAWRPSPLQEIIIAVRRGERERAMRIIEDGERTGELAGAQLGRAHVVAGSNFAGARAAFEQDLRGSRGFATGLDAGRWPLFVDYALTLERTGSTDAPALIAETLELVESQIAAGVVAGPTGIHMQFYRAQLYALSGNVAQSVVALSEAAAQSGLYQTPCLRDCPHFDSLLDHTAFAALIAEQTARETAERQRLTDQGLLLAPDEVLQSDDPSYDPFVVERSN